MGLAIAYHCMDLDNHVNIVSLSVHPWHNGYNLFQMFAALHSLLFQTVLKNTNLNSTHASCSECSAHAADALFKKVLRNSGAVMSAQHLHFQASTNNTPVGSTLQERQFQTALHKTPVSLQGLVAFLLLSTPVLGVSADDPEPLCPSHHAIPNPNSHHQALEDERRLIQRTAAVDLDDLLVRRNRSAAVVQAHWRGWVQRKKHASSPERVGRQKVRSRSVSTTLRQFTCLRRPKL